MSCLLNTGRLETHKLLRADVYSTSVVYILVVDVASSFMILRRDILSHLAACRRWWLHFFEHVVTSSQQRSHFFRQVKGRAQLTQILKGRFSFLTPLGIVNDRLYRYRLQWLDNVSTARAVRNWQSWKRKMLCLCTSPLRIQYIKVETLTWEYVYISLQKKKK